MYIKDIFPTNLESPLSIVTVEIVFVITRLFKKMIYSDLSLLFLILSCRNQGIPTNTDILFPIYTSFSSSSPLYHAWL